MFHCIEYTFYIRDFWATRACPEKQSCSGISHCIKYVFFIIQDFWATCACPEKQNCPGFFTVLKDFLSFRIFEQLELALKNRVCREIFHCIEDTFYIQEFWTTHACPEKQRVPWIHCTEYVLFIIQDFWATCACPEKQSCPGYFYCIEIFFIIQDFEQLALALKTEFALKFFKPGGAADPPLPDPPPRTPMIGTECAARFSENKILCFRSCFCILRFNTACL